MWARGAWLIATLLCFKGAAFAACDIMLNGPQDLTQGNKTYCLSGNITTSGGFNILNDNIVLDGQNFTVTETGGAFVGIGKCLTYTTRASDEASCRTSNVTVKNFNVIADHPAVDHFISLNAVSNSVFSNNHFTVTNIVSPAARGTTGSGMLVVLYQSFKNRFVGNTIYLTDAPANPADSWSYVFNLRNGSCGNQFLNNTVINASPGRQIVRMTSGSDTGWGWSEDNVIIGNRFFTAGDEVIQTQVSDVSDTTVINDNLLYAARGGQRTAVVSGLIGRAGALTLNRNTMISLLGGGIYIKEQPNSSPQPYPQINLKNNMILAGGWMTIDTGADTAGSPPAIVLQVDIPASDYNNLGRISGNASSLVFHVLSGFSTLAAWQGTGRDLHSISNGNLAALFRSPAVNFSNPQSLVLGDFSLMGPGIGQGEGGSNMGAPNGGIITGSSYPLYCSKVDSGPPPGDVLAPAAPANLQIN